MTATMLPPSRAGRSGLCVLLAEDDPCLRLAAQTTLVRSGFTVVAAVDGEAALTAARAQHFDLILLDLLMPKMDGLDVLRALKQDPTTRSMPVAILTNASREVERRTAAELGAVDFLIKADLSLKVLADKVDSLLGVTS
jgi:two-component system alkaline phosphatase synthesis response regulator PhoP